MRVNYDGAHLALQQALPELKPCVERLVAWDDFGGQPPGEYIIFGDTYGVWIKALVGLATSESEARALLQRALDFAEEMLTCGGEVAGLAIDTCAVSLDIMPGGRELASEMGGPALRRWMAEYSRGDWKRPDPEIIDLWGVREAVAARLSQVPLYEIPGITQPADHHLLRSLVDTKASADGVVVLYAYGKSGMFVLARGSIVHCDEDELRDLVVELAPLHHRKADVLTHGKPGVLYFDIPTREKVWNMTIGAERHARLTSDLDLWVAPSLEQRTSDIAERLS